MLEDFEIPGFKPSKKKSKSSSSAVGILGGSITAIVIVGVFLLLFFNSLFLASVGAGERGVKFSYFGGVQHDELSEGLHLKAPWVTVTTYNVKTMEYTMSVAANEGRVKGDDRIVAISKDGLSVGFDVTVLYHVMPEMASNIHQNVGHAYEDIIVRPACRTVIRDVAGEYVAMDMHQKRPEISENIFTQLKPLFEDKNIVLEQVLVRTIIRPPQIEQAIENKLKAEQEAQKMEFVIDKERKEAERKTIEAEGISSANKIIGESLTPSYLSWYWITNLDKHSSVIYVPTTDQGFPMFKDIDNTEAV